MNAKKFALGTALMLAIGLWSAAPAHANAVEDPPAAGITTPELVPLSSGCTTPGSGPRDGSGGGQGLRDGNGNGPRNGQGHGPGRSQNQGARDGNGRGQGARDGSARGGGRGQQQGARSGGGR